MHKLHQYAMMQLNAATAGKNIMFTVTPSPIQRLAHAHPSVKTSGAM